MNSTNINIILFIALFIPMLGIAQNKDFDKTIFEKCVPNETVTVSFSSLNYSPNLIGALKDDLIGFEDKIIDVYYDENNNTFSLKYNEYMSLDDLKSVFTKNQIDYMKTFQPTGHLPKQ